MVTPTLDVVDVGCDHALLDIFLAQTRSCHMIAADVNAKVYERALANVKAYQVEDAVEVVLTDGLTGISTKHKAVVIAGMGFQTIAHILTDTSNLDMDELIIQSNNEHEALRRFMTKQKFKITQELYLIDKHQDYILMKFQRGSANYRKIDYLVGPYLKKDAYYVKQLLSKKQKILAKIPRKYWIKRLNLYLEIRQIKKSNRS